MKELKNEEIKELFECSVEEFYTKALTENWDDAFISLWREAKKAKSLEEISSHLKNIYIIIRRQDYK